MHKAFEVPWVRVHSGVFAHCTCSGFSDSHTSCTTIIVTSGAAIQLNFRGIFSLFKSTHLEINMEILDMPLDLQLQVLFTSVLVGTLGHAVCTETFKFSKC